MEAPPACFHARWIEPAPPRRPRPAEWPAARTPAVSARDRSPRPPASMRDGWKPRPPAAVRGIIARPAPPPAATRSPTAATRSGTARPQKGGGRADRGADGGTAGRRKGRRGGAGCAGHGCRRAGLVRGIGLMVAQLLAARGAGSAAGRRPQCLRPRDVLIKNGQIPIIFDRQCIALGGFYDKVVLQIMLSSTQRFGPHQYAQSVTHKYR